MNVISHKLVPKATHQAVASFSGARWVTAGLLALAGLGHVPLVPEHLQEAPYMGVLFVLFAVSSLALGGVLAAKGSTVLYAMAGGLCLTAILAFVATRLIAFPQLSDDVGVWFEPLSVLCLSAELAVVALTAVVLSKSERRSPSPRHRAVTALG